VLAFNFCLKEPFNITANNCYTYSNMPDINLTYLAVVLVSILLSMTFHEAMHAFASHWLGDDTAKMQGRLTLNPLAHIDPITTVALPLFLVALGMPPFGAAKPVPFDPTRVRFGDYGAAIVGAAGPLTNLALAVVAGLFLQLSGASGVLVEVVYIFIVVNISFFVFNMIPFPPLDGSRVLYAVAPESVRGVMERIESMGFMAIIFFMLLFYAVLIEPFIQVVRFLITAIAGF
jgi:Zn-dependent protease